MCLCVCPCARGWLSHLEETELFSELQSDWSKQVSAEALNSLSRKAESSKKDKLFESGAASHLDQSGVFYFVQVNLHLRNVIGMSGANFTEKQTFFVATGNFVQTLQLISEDTSSNVCSFL